MINKQLPVLGVAFLVSSFLAFGAPGQPTDIADEKTIESLRVEYRDTLRLIVTNYEHEHKAGRVAMAQLISARNDSLESELEFPLTRNERIAVHEKLVENLRFLENHEIARAKREFATNVDLLKAKSRRLRAEIGLLEVKNAID